MLTVTPTASNAIRRLVDAADISDAAGVRIAAGEPTAQGTPLSLALVDGPQPGDEVVADGDAAVYLEPDVAAYLTHTVLDAQVSGDEVSFALRDDDAAVEPASRNGAPPL